MKKLWELESNDIFGHGNKIYRVCEVYQESLCVWTVSVQQIAEIYPDGKCKSYIQEPESFNPYTEVKMITLT